MGTITWTTIAQVAGRAAVGAGQAVAAQRVLGAVLGAGRQLDLPLALVARDLDRRAEHRLDGRDLDHVDQVLAAHRAAPHFEAEPAAAEEGLEDVLDRAEAGAAGREAAGRAGPRAP